MKSKMDTDTVFREKTVVLHNFIEKTEWKETEKKEYILYFGRYSEEKGIKTLLKACVAYPEIQFVFAGSGPLEPEINKVENVRNVGFQTGENLEKLIREARLSVYPSEWYENCPFSVMESQTFGTPVLGSDIGGIPELIRNGKTGELFKAKDAEDLKTKLNALWNNRERLNTYSQNCRDLSFDTVDVYCDKLIKYYLSDG
jgi:glycosyltransferase involved in cell wall biosynthesis